MTKISENYKSLLICILLASATLAVYWPVQNHEFINYDDSDYVTDNDTVRAGLSWTGVRWAFKSTVSGHWHPLTWLSHMLDCELFGLNPAGHHLMNLLLHIINTVLLFLIFNNCTGLTWQSAFIAALFALHPLHIESVAWVAERKDTLSTLFWLLTMGAYFRYAARGKIGFYVLSQIFFALGLMSKPMVVTLPAILLLMDFWPLERIGFNSLIPLKISPGSAPLGKIMVEKIPFFILAGISSVITIIIMKQGGMVTPVEGITVPSRFANALTSYAAYIIKTFWPTGLAPFYPHPGNSLALWKPIASLVFLTIITIATLRFGVRRRYLIVGWLWYLISLLPVIGLLQVGRQAMADRYTYVSLTGVFIILSLGIGELALYTKYSKRLTGIAAGVILTALAAAARVQLAYWQNSVALFEHTLKVTKNNSTAHNNLGSAYTELGRYQDAMQEYTEALRILPNHTRAYYNLGIVYTKLGQYEQAVRCYREATRIKPDLVEAHSNLGAIYLKLGRDSEAIESCKQAIKIDPFYVEAYYNLGFVYGKLGRYSEAAESYEQAIKIKADDAKAYYNLGFVCAKLGRHLEAVESYKQAIKIDPFYVEAHYNLGNAFFALGRYHEAAESYKQVIKNTPADADAHYNLGVVYLKIGDMSSALKEYEILKALDAEKAGRFFDFLKNEKGF